MKISISNMLEITLPKLNQTYEIETIKAEVAYKENTITIKKPIVFPIGSYIKISNARYNNGIFEVIGEEIEGYKLDKELMPGDETAVITPLNIPKGLLGIIKEMCVAADAMMGNSIKSITEGDTTVTYNENELFKSFSAALSSYKKLKTI